MSWWVYLEDGHGNTVAVQQHAEGGTYAVGGINRAELNVTYNYGKHFREAWPEPIEGSGALERMLDGRRADETLPLLEKAVSTLGTTAGDDYWAATEGNAGAALAILREWAREHPDAVWSVS